MRIHDGSYRIDLFGASHAGQVGAVLTGLPAGLAVDLDALQAFVSRRAPSGEVWSTQRRERDAVLVESGIEGGYTTGEPVALSVKNTDARPADYALFARVPRPSHADYPARVRYGDAADGTGGGPFSGRMTVGFCLAGGLVMQELNRRGVRIGAHLLSVGAEGEEGYPPLSIPDDLLTAGAKRAFPALTEDGEARMRRVIEQAAERGDSVGGVIECAATGCPTGLGGALTDGLEPRLARLLFAIPGARGAAFGAGYQAAAMTGSGHNDAYCLSEDGAVRTVTNHHGGVLGGMTTGMPLLFTVAMKPTPSIRLPQKTLDLATGRQTEFTIPGRHDACIAVRAVPVVEAVAAIILMDAIWEAEHETGAE